MVKDEAVGGVVAAATKELLTRLHHHLVADCGQRIKHNISL